MNTFRMKTLLCVSLVIFSLVEPGASNDPGQCKPACAGDQVCNLGDCTTLTNCECAIDVRTQAKCSFTKNTGDDETACGAEGCCWNKKKRRCYERNTKDRVKECARLEPASNRVDFGWRGITSNDCFCVGGCYDESIKGTYWCFEPKVPPPPLPVPVGGVCTVDDICEDPLSTCHNGICTCPSTHYRGGALLDKCMKLKELGETCGTGDVCKDSNAACSGGTCKCNVNFFEKGGVCVGTVPLGGSCGPSDQCADPHSSCTGGTCRCDAGYYKNGDVCDTEVELGQTCSAGGKCADPAAVCDGTCKCKNDYHDKNGVCVGHVDLGDLCDPQDHCSDPRAICNGLCVCGVGYFEKNRACNPNINLGEHCDSNDKFQDPNSYCDSNICKCKPNFYNKNGVCVGHVTLGNHCDPSDQCADPKATCKNNACTCNTGYFPKSGVCTPDIELGDGCASGDKCADPNAVCDTVCKCKANYHNKNGVCVGVVPLGGACDPDDHCADSHATCVRGKCTCGSGHFKSGDVCKEKVSLGGACSADAECKDDKATCTGGACRCPDGYMVENGACVEDPSAGLCPSGMTFNKEFSACYKAVTDPKTWCEAQQYCKSLDPASHLVEVRCQKKEDYVRSVVGGRLTWLGGRRLVGSHNNQFEWSFSNVLLGPYNNWQSGQPDGITTSSGPQTSPDCLIDGNEASGKWFDTSCERKAASLCEKYVIGRDVDLDGDCDAQDTCVTANSECRGGVCSCKTGFSKQNGQCVSGGGVCPIGMTFNKEFSACYKAVTDPKTWCEAQQYCRSLDPASHLVEVKSQKKEDYVRYVVGGRLTWLGGRRLVGSHNNQFEWSFSNVLLGPYSNWQSGQPDGITTSSGPQTPPDCLIDGNEASGKWFDTSCERKAASLCEKYVI